MGRGERPERRANGVYAPPLTASPAGVESGCANPADVRVEQATRFDLEINKRTAKALGLTIQLSVLARATDVIQ